MQDGQRVALNATLMIFKQVLMAALGVVFLGYVARKVGVAAWGEFQASLAIAGVSSLLAGVGVRAYLSREVAVHPELGPRHVGAALAIRGVTGVAALALTLAGAALVGAGVGVTLVALAAVSQLASLLYTTLWLSFEAHERFQYVVYAEVGARLFVIALASTLLALGGSVVAVGAAFLLGNVIELAITYGLLRARFYRPEFVTPAAELVEIAKKSIPIGLVTALSSALVQTDRVLLRAVSGQEAVGIYSAAWVLSENFRMIPEVFLGAAFAAGMRLYVRDREAFGRLYTGCMVTAAVLGMPIAAGVTLLAPDVIALVYGARGEYGPAAPVLRILVCQVPLAFAFQVGTLPIYAERRDLAMTKLLAASLLANVLLDLALIPRFGALGAAAATLAVSAGSLVVAFALAGPWIRSVSGVRVGAVAAATALMSCAAYGARQLGGMWAAIAIGPPAYVILLLALRAVSWTELRQLLARRVPAEATPAA